MNKSIKILLAIAFTNICIAQNNYVDILPSDSHQEIIKKAAEVVPNAKQLSWQELEMTTFLHFGINTFTNREWGDGAEDPKLFNPTELDANQWVKACKDGGSKMLILTAKHHDGFCLWPSKFTEHSVKSSPWKNGNGDVVKELAKACKEYDMKLGIYLSPWDRNNPSYGTEAYNDYFVNQLTELLTNYGEIAEVWFDGANGEGSNGKKQEYDWQRYYLTIRKLQPNAVIAVVGPDVRWVGTESGYGRDTEWSVLPSMIQDKDKIAAESQQKTGTFLPSIDAMAQNLGSREMLYKANRLVWYPSEVDVSIRPGWFYHKDQDSQVKTVDKLLDIYYSSVGKNSLLLLNVPPDTRGLIHENDVNTLKKWYGSIKETFKNNLLENATLHHSSGKASNGLNKLVDQSMKTAWKTKKTDHIPSLVFQLNEEKVFNRLLLQEQITSGQRIEEFTLEAWVHDKWLTIAEGTTIGYKRLIRFSDVKTNKIRFSILQSREGAALAEIGLFKQQN